MPIFYRDKWLNFSKNVIELTLFLYPQIHSNICLATHYKQLHKHTLNFERLHFKIFGQLSPKLKKRAPLFWLRKNWPSFMRKGKLLQKFKVEDLKKFARNKQKLMLKTWSGLAHVFSLENFRRWNPKSAHVHTATTKKPLKRTKVLLILSRCTAYENEAKHSILETLKGLKIDWKWIEKRPKRNWTNWPFVFKMYWYQTGNVLKWILF